MTAARELLRDGLVEGTSGNLSIRLEGDRVALTPANFPYPSMTAADIAVTDLEGRLLDGEHPPTSERALHIACLRAFPEIGAVIHSHARFATMFAVAREPIPDVIEEFSCYVGGPVEVAPFEASGSDALGEVVAHCLGARGAVLLANHGLVAIGRDLDEAMKITALVERTAEIVIGARDLGELHAVPEEARRVFAERYWRTGSS